LCTSPTGRYTPCRSIWRGSKCEARRYLSGRTTGRTVIQWLIADGKAQPLWSDPSFYQFPQVSPDGKRLLSVVADGAISDIWVYEPERGTKTRVTDGAGVSSYPIWSADGQYVIFQFGAQLHWVSADGAERPQVLLKTAGPSFPTAVTVDGRLVYYELKPGGGSLIQTVPIATKSGSPVVGEPATFRELSAGNPVPTVSPDGRWVAYASTESGVYEVYVRAFPDTGRQWAVSTGGGSFPVWSSTGNELFYRTEDQYLMVTLGGRRCVRRREATSLVEHAPVQHRPRPELRSRSWWQALRGVDVGGQSPAGNNPAKRDARAEFL
jgi:eukaryotic-like serine/threonine-protein kinase